MGVSHYILVEGWPVEVPVWTSSGVIDRDALEAWGLWQETHSPVVARTEVGFTVVSTIFLGIAEHSAWHVPLLFETMTFGPDGEVLMKRYATRPAALRGHHAVVRMLTRRMKHAGRQST